MNWTRSCRVARDRVSRSRWSGLLFGALVWLMSGPLRVGPTTAAEAGLNLAGSWYVLIHYRDSASDDPEAERWRDAVWSFEERGSRLQWTLYPIVILEDQSGRFERLGAAGELRVLHYWEPNAVQRAQIEEGLQVSPRGSVSKGLRGSVERGYSSVGGLRAQGASVIGYSERWAIDGLPRAPVFTRAVVMGSVRTESMEGRTRLTTRAVREGGRRLEGSYERDGTSRGTFVMTRIAQFGIAGGKGATRTGTGGRERSFLDDFSGEFFGSPGEREALEARIRAQAEQGEVAAARREVREHVVANLRRAMRHRERGTAAVRRSELALLAAKLEAMIFDEGKSLEQIEQMWRRGELRP